MADITSFLNTIKTAIYGRDMRSALHDSIKAVNDALESEVKRSTAKDTSHDESIKNLDERLQQEANNRSSADDGLSKRITDEANARSNADTALGKRIDDEAEARRAADDALGQRVADEVAARSAADNALSDRIDEEAAAREELNKQFEPVARTRTRTYSTALTLTACASGTTARKARLHLGNTWSIWLKPIGNSVCFGGCSA